MQVTFLQLLMADGGLYKVDHLTLNSLNPLIKTCETSCTTSDYVKKIPLDLWFSDFWDKLGSKVDYITTWLTPRVLYNTGEIVHNNVDHTYYDTLDDYEKYIDNINGYLCLYSINKIIHLGTMKVSYEVRDVVLTTPTIKRDVIINKLIN